MSNGISPICRHGDSNGRVMESVRALVLGMKIDQSSLEAVLPYMNNIAWLFDMQPVLWHSCFLGTTGEYDLGVIPKGDGSAKS